MEKYVERLVSEWLKHTNIILAVDYDSTISYWNTIENQEDIKRAIDLIRRCQETGCYVVIHTACRPDRHSEILEYCKKIGIRVDAINDNPFELPYGGKGSKIFYNHQLCDRSGLVQAMDILETALYRVRGTRRYGVTYDDYG